MSAPNYSQDRLQRLYMAMQSSFNTAATLAGSNACRFVMAKFNNKVGLVTPKDKTGTRTAPIGTAGRAHGEWEVELTVRPNGTPGVAPDCDPIFQSAFGGASTVIGSTTTFAISSSTNASPIVLTTAAHGQTVGTYVPVSVVGHTVNTAANGMWLALVSSTTSITLQGSSGTAVGGASGTINVNAVAYTIQEPNLPVFTAGSYQTPSTLAQQIAIGCTTKSIELSFGENDGVMLKASGENLYTIDSYYFSTAPSDRTGGLGSFPNEPSSPVTNGTIFAGFTGGMVIGGTKFVTARTATVNFGTGTEVVKDLFGSYVPDSVEADVRDVTVTMSIYNADDAATQAVIIAGQTKTPVDVILQGGTVQGNCIFVRLHNVQFETTQLEDGQIRFTRSIPASRAFGSTAGLDEMTMWYA